MTRSPLELALAVLLPLSVAACGDDDHGAAGATDDAGTPHDDAGAHAGAGGGNAGSGNAGSGSAGDGGLHDAGPESDASAPSQDASAPSQDAGAPPFGGLVPDTDWSAQDLDLFGTPGHHFWFEVDEEQLARMNLEQGGGPGPIFDGFGNLLADDDPLAQAMQRDGIRLDAPIIGGFGGDLYTPGDTATWADHLVVEDADSGRVADYGKVEAALVGESTGRAWDFLHIPNIRVDADQFEKKKRIGGFEHIRFNNGQVGSIFREAIAHRIYRELGYPALRSSWAFVGSNVWGSDVWVPMVLMEVYKKKFCNDNAELLGGTCENMWEFPGSIGDSVGSVVADDACQTSECDNSRLEELSDVVAMTPLGTPIEPVLEDLLDWKRFHEFQCLSWMLWTGDDPIHGGNNNLIMERDDGKLIWAPYSIDISAGQDWYTNVPLPGSTPIANRCQVDPECWADTIETCEQLIEKFDDLDPEKLVDDARETLDELGMLRSGDEQRAKVLREWYVQRQRDLPDELERYRYLPDEYGSCADGLELCGDGGCGTTEQCAERLCPPEQTWCESTAACVNPLYEPCPLCQPGQCPSDEDGGVIVEPPILEL